MATINVKQLNRIKDYYQQGLSVREIAEKMGVSIDAVYYFFRKYNIPRRAPKENREIQFQKKPLSFKVGDRLSLRDEKLKVAGLMLYWGEGTSRGRTVDFVNSNVLMIKLFLNFLRGIYRVDEKRLRVLLYCYSNQNKNELIQHWSKITKIPISQFSKPYVRTDYSMKAGRQMQYGLIHIRYSDKKLLQCLLEEIGRYIRDNE